MRALIASTLALAFLIGGWFCFYHYSDRVLHNMISVCEDEIMPSVETDRWDEAFNQFETVYHRWHQYKKWALFMLDTEKINEADCTFAKTRMYIKAEDLSNSSGELLSLQEILKMLHENERLSLANIF